MATYDTEERLRQRRTKSEQAISLAMKSRWDEAIQVNREIIELFPNEVDAYNRLGKALMELGQFGEARAAYTSASKLDPMNSIAQKNLQRLTKLVEQGGVALPPSSVDPRLFIEESGKTATTRLTEVRSSEAVAKLAAGDKLGVEVRGKQLLVVNTAGQEIGRLEPRLEQDLVELLKKGNTYSVFVTAVSDQGINVIIREMHRAPSMGNRPSFRPSSAESGFRGYTREGVLRYDLDEDEDEDLEEEEEEEEETEEAAAAEPDAEPAAAKVNVTTLEGLAEEENAQDEEE